jgi:mRNA-degrading endonuclease toxin of MazEF toxin-antitoxin module
MPKKPLLVHFDEDLLDGIPADCALSLDNIQSIPKAALKGRITTIQPGRLEEIRDALAYALGC